MNEYRQWQRAAKNTISENKILATFPIARNSKSRFKFHFPYILIEIQFSRTIGKNDLLSSPASLEIPESTYTKNKIINVIDNGLTHQNKVHFA